MVDNWDRIIHDWDRITNPAKLSFVPKLATKKIIKKKISPDQRFANIRYLAVDSRSSGGFVDPYEELNYSLRENIFGERVRS